MARRCITKLTKDEWARIDGWADRWIEIGLRTGPADRERFEAAARDCYRYAGIDWPEVVAWVPSPLALALAAPAAAVAIELIDAVQRPQPQDSRTHAAVRDAIDGAANNAVIRAVASAIHHAVGGAVEHPSDRAAGFRARSTAHVVRRAVNVPVVHAVRKAAGLAMPNGVAEALGGAADGAVDGAVIGAVHSAVAEAVAEALGGAVGDVVGASVQDALRGAAHDDVVRRVVADEIASSWWYCVAGQFRVGGRCSGPAYTSFFRDVCKLELDGDLWDRGRAYEATAESACWWWPHRRFVMVCERPLEIHRELADPPRTRGRGSHRLHRDHGPAVLWPDGFGVWAIHGVRVPRRLVEAPETLTPAQILSERNTEVRRVMIDLFGADRLIRDTNAQILDDDPEWGRLLGLGLNGDEPLVMVEVVNSTPEPDGLRKRYVLRVPPTICTAREAIAWTFDLEPHDYMPSAQT